MARVKRSVNARKKRRTTFERAKGYYGARSRTYRSAKEQVQHSLQYQYRDRRNKKREFRRLWIQRINAACHANDLSYSQFMHGLKVAGVELDRKVLAQIAYDDAETFASLCTVARDALNGDAPAPVEEEPAPAPVEEVPAEEPQPGPAPAAVAETQEPDPEPEEAAAETPAETSEPEEEAVDAESEPAPEEG